jgi:hypothetical protein
MEKKAEVEVAKGIQNELGTRITKHNKPVKKYVQIEKKTGGSRSTS